jgi:tRNA-specific 2-thiouridylase
VNFVREYWNEVFSPFLEAYQAGIETPNPDAFCNRHVKFKHLLKFVSDKLGIDTIATGHYSRIAAEESVAAGGSDIESSPTKVKLLRGVDPLKDQSYFLALTKVTELSANIISPSLFTCTCTLHQLLTTQGSALEKVLLPIGHLSKAEVKAIAALRLPALRVLSKPESMGICFIGKRDMRDFLDDYITLTPGRYFLVAYFFAPL